jgi:hypothetical protein
MASSKKKSYINNPALQFISSAFIEDAEETEKQPPAAISPEIMPDSPSERANGAAGATRQTAENVNVGEIRASGGQNTARYDASAQDERAFADDRSGVQPRRKAPKEEVRMRPLYVEVRSKRVNALLQPSLYKKLSALASKQKISVNELIHRALEEYVETK